MDRFPFLKSNERPSQTEEKDSPLSQTEVVRERLQWRQILSRKNVGKMVNSWQFRAVVLLSIFFNAVIIGVETNVELAEKHSTLFTVLDEFLLSIAVVEIALKWYSNFLLFWKSGWNVFDFFVVFVSVLIPAFTFITDAKFFRAIKVMRSLRLLRGINVLPGLQLVVQTVLQSVSDMANILLLLVIVMFIFAIVGVSFFGEYSYENFGELPQAMFTLFICVTQDGWMVIFEKLRAKGQYVTAAIYFTIFITIGAFVFANLIVAVVVTNLEASVAQQQKQGTEQQSSDTENVKATENQVAELPKVSQTPFEISQFHKNLSSKKLENYFLVLSAIEDNLHRFKCLKDELSQILYKLKHENSHNASPHRIHSDANQPISPSPIEARRSSQPIAPTLSHHARKASIALRGPKTGDLLSDFVMLNRKKKIDSMCATNMEDLMRQTAKALFIAPLKEASRSF
ncbi:cation channel sperm-associated protein 4-like [Oscarella lobularis]|uniref:cation channel sperm-associated protein 4-like n=1 Tax=Oscarella lobularis TaxID=121494 RepID=UPI00331364CB